MKPQILFVDDEPRVLEGLRRSLRDWRGRWQMVYTDQPATAWERLVQGSCDAVVTDVRMPEVTGLELIQRMQHDERTRNVPVIVLTGLTEYGLKRRALELGAIDLLHKPVDVGELVARLENLLRLKSHQDNLNVYNAMLRDRIRQQADELIRSRLSFVCRLARAAECRDHDTGNHVIRVACYSRAIAASLGMPHTFQERILLTAPLHDIGKIGIPDAILLKRGPLSPGEWTVMQKHCAIGERILQTRSNTRSPLLDWFAETDEGATDPIFETAAAIALTHHEKWDGSGYPLGLAGESIPLESRIVAIADVFDALVSRRPYRPPLPEAEVLEILRDARGVHFDPEVYAAFCDALPEIGRNRALLADGAVWSNTFEETPS